LLRENEIEVRELLRAGAGLYTGLKNPGKAMARDLSYLVDLRTVEILETPESARIRINLEWPAEITENRFFEITRNFPKAKPHSFTS